MNGRAKEWLKGEMVDKDKWALAYDDKDKLQIHKFNCHVK